MNLKELQNMSEHQLAIRQFDDDKGLDQRKASLEAREKELMVHIPLQFTTVSSTRTGSKLHGQKFQLYDQQQLYLKKKKLRVVIIFLCAAINFGK